MLSPDVIRAQAAELHASEKSGVQIEHFSKPKGHPLSSISFRFV